jgi:hypothetical protein
MYRPALESYVAAAEPAGYRAWMLPADDIKPIDEMFCLIHVDDRDRDYLMHLMYPNQLTAAGGLAPSDTDLTLLQLTMKMPFPVAIEPAGDLALLLHAFNLYVPIGQFILSDQERQVVMRGALTHVDAALPPWMVVEAIDMMRLFALRFGDLIEQVASGAATYARTVADLIAQSERLTAPPDTGTAHPAQTPNLQP